MVVGLKFEADPVVKDPQIAVSTNRDRVRHNCLHLLSDNTDISSTPAIIDEAIEPKAVFEMAEQGDAVLKPQIRPPPASPEAAATMEAASSEATTAVEAPSAEATTTVEAAKSATVKAAARPGAPMGTAAGTAVDAAPSPSIPHCRTGPRSHSWPGTADWTASATAETRTAADASAEARRPPTWPVVTAVRAPRPIADADVAATTDWHARTPAHV
jgi:hypothetical protein